MSPQTALQQATDDDTARVSGEYHAVTTGLFSGGGNTDVKVEMATLLSGGRFLARPVSTLRLGGRERERERERPLPVYAARCVLTVKMRRRQYIQAR